MPTCTKGVTISKDIRRNEEIRAKRVRLIDNEGEQVGVVDRDDALKRAREAGKDLLEVAPKADPPVVKILDWGKYQYEQAKKLKNQKQKQSELKQMRFGLKIGKHDRDVKIKHIKRFLEDGDKVRISIFFRGREMAHKELGRELLDEIYEEIKDIAVIDQEPQLSGRYLNMVVRSQ